MELSSVEHASEAGGGHSLAGDAVFEGHHQVDLLVKHEADELVDVVRKFGPLCFGS